MKIESLTEKDIDSLHPLMESFVQTHQSLTFKANYWQAFRDWLKKRLTDSDTFSLLAIADGGTIGFIVGEIRKNAPLISPEEVGHVSLLAVAESERRKGIGKSLWNALRSEFVSRGTTYFELYTEYGNEISGPFWSKRGFDTFLEKRRL